MAEALRGGARGVEPPAPTVPDGATEATRMLEREPEDATAATRMLPREEATRVREPAPAPPRRRERAAPRARRRERRRGRRRGRWILATLLVAAAAAAGGIVAADQLGGQPKLRRVVTDDAHRAIQEVRKFVEDNTR
jgi:ferric-dicitrate binding protein FerR (iron transport regulator)